MIVVGVQGDEDGVRVQIARRLPLHRVFDYLEWKRRGQNQRDRVVGTSDFLEVGEVAGVGVGYRVGKLSESSVGFDRGEPPLVHNGQTWQQKARDATSS